MSEGYVYSLRSKMNGRGEVNGHAKSPATDFSVTVNVPKRGEVRITADGLAMNGRDCLPWGKLIAICDLLGGME